MISSIAHPTDLSPEGMLAFEHGLALAIANRCRLDVLHVIAPDQPSAWSGFPRVREVLQRWGLLEPGAPVEAIRAETGVTVQKVEIYDRDAVDGLSRYLGEHRSDLVVMASHGRAGLDRLLNNSVSVGLAQLARVPTLIMGPESRPFVDRDTGQLALGRVLVPVDHKPSPHGALVVLDGLIEGRGVALDFVHVGSAPPVLWDRQRVRRPVRALEGPIVETLLVEAQDASLVVMPTEGAHGLADLLRGSTTEQIVRQVTCPVLAIPVN